MGLLTKLMAMVLGRSLGGPVTMLLPVVLGMLGGKGNLGGLGGLGGILGKLKEGGLGDQADSWVSTGANKPVSSDQLRSALGDDNVDAVAREAGVSKEDALRGLAKHLPDLIDKLTPDGSVPGGADLEDRLGSLLKGLGN